MNKVRGGRWPAVRLCLSLFSLVLALGGLSGVTHAADYFNGRTIYEMHCQTCHGVDGRSMLPGTPDFSTGEALFRPDADLFEQIRQGKQTMPAFRGLLTDDEILDVIAYLRSLRK